MPFRQMHYLFVSEYVHDAISDFVYTLSLSLSSACHQTIVYNMDRRLIKCSNRKLNFIIRWFGWSVAIMSKWCRVMLMTATATFSITHSCIWINVWFQTKQSEGKGNFIKIIGNMLILVNVKYENTSNLYEFCCGK